jgi:hypothetical protein
MASIRRNADARLHDVLRILEDPRTADLGLIVFPGWTLVGKDLPEEVIKAAEDRTVVIETLLPASERLAGLKSKSGKASFIKATKGAKSWDEEVPWHTYVIHGGEKSEPYSQRIITSAQAGRVGNPSPRVLMLNEELVSGRRSWTSGSALWICGEVNALYGGGRSEKVEPLIASLPVKWSIVANPAHRPKGPQAMRDKRAYLSRGGVLLTTANTHNGWEDSKRHWQNAGKTAAQIYRGGRRVPLESMRGSAPAPFEIEGHRIVIIETI